MKAAADDDNDFACLQSGARPIYNTGRARLIQCENLFVPPTAAYCGEP
jgi:hypothetical protein